MLNITIFFQLSSTFNFYLKGYLMARTLHHVRILVRFSMAYQVRQLPWNITKWMLKWCETKNWVIR